MQIGEIARRAGVTTKAVRYYEQLGLVDPTRALNGYRDYDEDDVRIVAEIHDLAGMGITAGKTRPFIECLELGHTRSDDCVSSLAAYRDSIADIDRAVAALMSRRRRLVERLESSAARGFATEPTVTTDDYLTLPSNLPAPEDDGAAAHLPGLVLPDVTLTASDGARVDLAALGGGRCVIYAYPLTGRPGVDLPAGWDAIPGARGCSTEACGFRDHFAQLRDAGATRVYGLSSQTPAYQAEVVGRLRLPFTMLSDPDMRLADLLDLPTFAAPGHDRLYARLTLIVNRGRIEHVFYPIFPPNTHAGQVLAWLRDN